MQQHAMSMWKQDLTMLCCIPSVKFFEDILRHSGRASQHSWHCNMFLEGISCQGVDGYHHSSHIKDQMLDDSRTSAQLESNINQMRFVCCEWQMLTLLSLYQPFFSFSGCHISNGNSCQLPYLRNLQVFPKISPPENPGCLCDHHEEG